MDLYEIISEFLFILITLIIKIKVFLGSAGFLTPEALVIYLSGLFVNLWRLPQNYRRAKTKALLFNDRRSVDNAKNVFTKFRRHFFITGLLICFCMYVLYFEYKMQYYITNWDFSFLYYGTVPSSAEAIKCYYYPLVSKLPGDSIFKFVIISFLVGGVIIALISDLNSRKYFKTGTMVTFIAIESSYIVACLTPSLIIMDWSTDVTWNLFEVIRAYVFIFTCGSIIAFFFLIQYERFQFIRWLIRGIKLFSTSWLLGIVVGLSDYSFNFLVFTLLWTIVAILVVMYLKEKGIGLLGNNGFGLEDFNNNFVSNTITGERPGLDIIKGLYLVLSANFKLPINLPGLGATRELRYFYYQCKYKQLPWKIFFTRVLDIFSAATSFILPAALWGIFVFLIKTIILFYYFVVGLLVFCLIFNYFKNRNN